MKLSKRKLLSLSVNVIVLLCSAVLCLVLIDAVIVFFNLDAVITSKTTYVFCDSINLYRQTKDTERLYELSPNAKTMDSEFRRSDDIDQNEILFSSDSLGFRSNGGIEHTKKKPDGVFRIIALGGSNTFGYCVSDSQTWPAQLEKVLNERMPGRFEVWNAGLSSYNMVQKMTYAKQIIKEYEPDLLLFQHCNIGRRAFLAEADYSYFFRRNKDLWYENIPLICCYVSHEDIAWHKFLVRNWALYRVVLASCNYFLISGAFRDQQSPAIAQLNFALRQYFDLCFTVFPDRITQQRVREFIVQVNKTGGPRMAVIDNTDSHPEDCFIKELPIFFIQREAETENRPKKYYEIHPPSQVYEWYGEKIADWLIAQGLVREK